MRFGAKEPHLTKKIMKVTIVLVCAMLLMANCVEKKKEPNKQESIVEDTIPTITNEDETIVLDKSSFKANGSEPLWDLKLFEDRFELDMDESQIAATLTEPITLEGSNLKMYRIQQEAMAIDIIIAQKECLDTLTNKKSPYTVTISYKDVENDSTIILEGCGAYITDYHLHGKWILDQLGSKPISTMSFQGEDLPFLEIDTKTNRFSGMAGCNRMTGEVIFDDNLLRFSEAAVTRMACPNLELESQFLLLLASGTGYSIQGGQLHLTNAADEAVLHFKKSY